MFFLKLPSLNEARAGLSCRSAPSKRKTARSAVASVTGSGAYVTVISLAVQASTSIWSYPAPLWAISLTDLGSCCINSASNFPATCAYQLSCSEDCQWQWHNVLTAPLAEVRYIAATPSYFVRQSSKNSMREALVTSSGAVDSWSFLYSTRACLTGLNRRILGLVDIVQCKQTVMEYQPWRKRCQINISSCKNYQHVSEFVNFTATAMDIVG